MSQSGDPTSQLITRTYHLKTKFDDPNKSSKQLVKMPAKLDLAILEALSLDPSKTTISSHGGSGFSSTSKIASTVDGSQKLFFIKTGTGTNRELMFAGIYHFVSIFHEQKEDVSQTLALYPIQLTSSFLHISDLSPRDIFN